MTDVLGYERFAARGSDQGALVLQQIALRSPGRLIGLHRSGITPFADPVPDDLSLEELEYQNEVAAWVKRETAYAVLQSTRPETLVPALADSPVALASWFVEKFQRWGDCGEQQPDVVFGRDRLLDNLTLHWLSGSGVSATRLYRQGPSSSLKGRAEVPTAILMPLKDAVTVPAPRSWCERQYIVRRFTILEHGGHFPEWEVPHAVADDVRAFFATLS